MRLIHHLCSFTPLPSLPPRRLSHRRNRVGHNGSSATSCAGGGRRRGSMEGVDWRERRLYLAVRRVRPPGERGRRCADPSARLVWLSLPWPMLVGFRGTHRDDADECAGCVHRRGRCWGMGGGRGGGRRGMSDSVFGIRFSVFKKMNTDLEVHFPSGNLMKTTDAKTCVAHTLPHLDHTIDHAIKLTRPGLSQTQVFV